MVLPDDQSVVGVAVPEGLDVGWGTRSWRTRSEDEATVDLASSGYAESTQLHDLPVMKAISLLVELLHCRLLPTMVAV